LLRCTGEDIHNWSGGTVSVEVDAYAALTQIQATLPVLSLAVSNQQTLVTVRQAVPGWTYVLQTSTNLAAWSPALTNLAMTNILVMPDANTLEKTRYYRVLVP